MNTEATSSALLRQYSDLGEFLCEALGEEFAVVVYSVNEDATGGAVYSTAGMQTDRAVGDPMTPMVKHLLASIVAKDLASVVHIDTEASTADGRTKLCFKPIREQDGRLVGLLMLYQNIELSCMLYDMLGRRLDKGSEGSRSKIFDMVGTEYASLTNYMLSVIRGEIASYQTPVEQMSMEEKRQIVRALEKKEVFYVRDSVRVVSELLGVSVPTVYRLLKRSIHE